MIRKYIFLSVILVTIVLPQTGEAATQTIKIYSGSGDGQAGIGTDEGQYNWEDARTYTGVVTYTTQDYADSNTARSDRAAGAYRLYRGTLPFDTSSIPDTADVVSASLNLYGYNSNGSEGGAQACITTGERSDVSNVVGSDYYLSNYGTTTLSTTAILVDYQYTKFGLNLF